MAIEQIVYEDVDWIYLAQDRDHWRTRVNFRVPRNSGNFLTSLTTLGFSLIALMMEAVRTSETSFNIYLTTRRYIPEYSKVHTRRRENLKSDILKNYFFEIIYQYHWNPYDAISRISETQHVC
jgi:hypothetical protein